ncbi:MAG: hypothetical protein QOG85_755 [Gaiellaceae bacterium]|nr:hypothetical protein [Gaiellaceae bacterium]
MPDDEAFFDDDLVGDLIRMLMRMDAKLDELLELLLEEDDGEESDE